MQRNFIAYAYADVQLRWFSPFLSAHNRFWYFPMASENNEHTRKLCKTAKNSGQCWSIQWPKISNRKTICLISQPAWYDHTKEKWWRLYSLNIYYYFYLSWWSVAVAIFVLRDLVKLSSSGYFLECDWETSSLCRPPLEFLCSRIHWNSCALTNKCQVVCSSIILSEIGEYYRSMLIA